MKRHGFPGAMAVVLATLSCAAAVAADDGSTYKVFIYAGQSNAQGKAPIAVADAQAKDPALAGFYEHLRKDGAWVVRDDVFFRYASQGPSGTHGPLRIGMGSHRFGGDYEFASMMGEHFTEPVVISKSAFGGSSLCENFRPPSAGLPPADTLEAKLKAARARAQAKKLPEPTMDDIKKSYGELYRTILADYAHVTANAATLFPPLAGKKPELAGFVWFQGWNDQYGGQDEYASNLKHFIKDLRRDLGKPDLPFVIVAMGQNGSTPATGPMLTIRDAQMAIADDPEFKGTVASVRADLLVDKDAERTHANRQKDPEAFKKYGADDAYHYYGSPIWYTRIGHAAGEAMLGLLGTKSSSAAGRGPVKIFVLAGDSNCEGKAATTLVDHLVSNPDTAVTFKHLKNADGSYARRDDVWVRFFDRKGDLTVGYGGGPNQIGIELEFGNELGDALDEQVLLIKTAWGGSGLSRNFGSPSSGAPGECYTKMIDNVKDTLANLKTLFPGYDEKQGYEIAGFVWFSGWNDAGMKDYAEKLANLIRDVRKDLGAPRMPVVIGELGVGGPPADGVEKNGIRLAQMAVADMPEFKGDVLYVKTAEFYDKEAEKMFRDGSWKGDNKEKFATMASDRPFHFMGSAKTFCLMGDAMGKGMVTLLKP